jgi:exonuclease III
MNRYSDKLMKMIGDITAGKRSSGLLYSVTTNKATRVGLRQNGISDKSWIDYFIISTYLKHSIISPAIVHDEIGDVSDHYPIVLSFQNI